MKTAYLALIVALGLGIMPVKSENMYPGGILRNNPGNLVKTHDTWVGMTRLQEHERFVRFIQPIYGIRAMMKTLLTYQNKHELNTISKIITRWAPPRENNTPKYIHNVSMDSGFAPDAPINLHNKYTLIEIVKAIVIQENGTGQGRLPVFWYEDSVYQDAAEMALGEE